MDSQQFAELAAAGYNRIPVMRDVLADMDTPLSAYLKIASGAYSYLFESVQGGEKWGRYSMMGLPCREVLKVFGHEVILERSGEVVERSQVDDPLAFVEQFQQRYNVASTEELPVFFGGLVGYFGYDTVRYVEPKLAQSTPRDELDTPDILLMVSEEVLVFDNLSGVIHLVCLADPGIDGSLDTAMQRLDELENKLLDAVPRQSSLQLRSQAVNTQLAGEGEISEQDFRSGFTEEKFKAAVETIKEYVLAGDVMQVVPSQRLSVGFEAPPLDLYRSLRNLNPSPYMYFLDLGDFHIVGSSPEILARSEHGQVTVRPIAGTRRRGYTEQEDIELEQELLSDPKEIAEHLMLIDLGRNDAGRVSEIGTVELTDKMIVERYSHVMHIVSNVVGKLRENLSAVDVLRATLPAGTLSGAPKIRAMEIIDELEPVKRGIYGGAVGYIGWAGNMDTAIAIRTAVVKDSVLYVQAGAGIVADSVPSLEWKETMNKARAIFRAATMASQSLAACRQNGGES